MIIALFVLIFLAAIGVYVWLLREWMSDLDEIGTMSVELKKASVELCDLMRDLENSMSKLRDEHDKSKAGK